MLDFEVEWRIDCIGGNYFERKLLCNYCCFFDKKDNNLCGNSFFFQFM